MWERRLIKTATSPFYIYLAYHNVHGAVNVPSATLQAPRAAVELYNRTYLDTCAEHRSSPLGWRFSSLTEAAAAQTRWRAAC